MCVARHDAQDGRDERDSVDSGAAMTRGAGSLVPGGAKGVNMQVVGGAKETGLTQATASTTELKGGRNRRRYQKRIWCHRWRKPVAGSAEACASNTLVSSSSVCESLQPYM